MLASLFYCISVNKAFAQIYLEECFQWQVTFILIIPQFLLCFMYFQARIRYIQSFAILLGGPKYFNFLGNNIKKFSSIALFKNISPQQNITCWFCFLSPFVTLTASLYRCFACIHQNYGFLTRTPLCSVLLNEVAYADKHCSFE